MPDKRGFDATREQEREREREIEIKRDEFHHHMNTKER
jgi:hypothetical protein